MAKSIYCILTKYNRLATQGAKFDGRDYIMVIKASRLTVTCNVVVCSRKTGRISAVLSTRGFAD